MTLTQLFSQLRERHIKLWEESGNLRFSAPKGALSAELRTQIIAQKPEILDFLTTVKTPASQTIPRISRDESIELSHTQQRVWFIDQFESGLAAYNISTAVQLQGALDQDALEQAFLALIQRHEVLRTSVVNDEGQPRLHIHDQTPFSLEKIDLRTASNQEAAIQTAASTLTQHQFDLNNSPLLKVALLQLSADEFVLVLVMHHLISDGWSLGVIVREIAALYEAELTGTVADLAPLSIQYIDYAAWQREQLMNEQAEQDLAYWQEKLAGRTAPLQMPIDHARPPEQTFDGAACEVWLSAETQQSLETFSHQNDATLFMTLLTAFNAVLHRYTGKSDIVVGTPIAGRTHHQLENLIGFFANSLALHTEVADNPTFSELLQQVRANTLDAFSHQDTPLERIIEALEVERDLSYSPLFQVLFALQNTPLPTIELSGLRLEPLHLTQQTAQFDLALNAIPQADGLQLVAIYNTALFEQATIERFLGHFQTLLAAAIAEPDRAVGTLPLLNSAEKEAVLWRAQTHYPPQDTLIDRFMQQVAQHPHKIALQDGSQTLTYQELNCRANQIAHLLQAQGIQPESRVGLHVERSLNVLIGILGIMKAGGAYVPMDPVYPAKRIGYIIADSEVEIVLTQADLCENLPEQVTPICFDRDAAQIAEASQTNPVSTLTPDNLAYMIYTSGSTGQPKGVLVTQYNVVRLFQATDHWYQFSAEDVFTLFHSYAFDVAVWEMWGALLHGGKLIIVPQIVSQSPATFYQWLIDERVTVLDQTPSAFQNLIAIDETHTQRDDLSLRSIIFAGEALHLPSLEPWFERHGDQKPLLTNMYGITETTVHTTYRPITMADVKAGNGSLIGGPMLDTELYILDAYQQPVPWGVTGEIYVGGPSMARGYRNRDDLTTERFLPNPFQPDMKMYRSGDLARAFPNGEIEYLGRIDHQIQLNGFRVELGEIEQQLGEHPAVQDVAVLAREIQSHQQLVAYLVSHEAPPAVPELRQYLAKSLPHYMIPAHFMFLDEMPLTANGKLNRQGLPQPEFDRAQLETELVSGRNSAEKNLTAIWSDILGHDEIGIYDNFFELGGDSILSMRVVAKAKNVGLHITPKLLFSHPTIADLASYAKEITEETTLNEQGIVTGDVSLTPIQQWFFERDLRDPHQFNHAVLLTIPESAETAHLEAAFMHILQQHDALRLSFRQTENGWQQANETLPEQALVCETINLRGGNLAELVPIYATKAHRSLCLEQGKIVRLLRFQTGTAEDRLLIIVHHLAIDGVSWRILLEDLYTSYTAISQGQTPHSLPKTTSFQQWSTLLETYAQADTLQNELPYWEQVISKIEPLPTDSVLPESANTEAQVKRVWGHLSAEKTTTLLHDLPERYQTKINDILLTALVETFGSWTGERRLGLNLEGHGREDIFPQADLSRTIGWFTSLFPVYLDATEAYTPSETVKIIKEQLRQVPQNGIGYGILRYLKRASSLCNQPEPQVSFNYFGQFDEALAGAFSPAPEETGQANSPRQKRAHLIDINAQIVEQKLSLSWTYNTTLYEEKTIQYLAETFITALDKLIENDPDGQLYTPSDFPELDFDQSQLDSLMAQLM